MNKEQAWAAQEELYGLGVESFVVPINTSAAGDWAVVVMQDRHTYTTPCLVMTHTNYMAVAIQKGKGSLWRASQ